MSMNNDLSQIESFLYEEAGYLYIPDLDSWLALYSEDCMGCC